MPMFCCFVRPKEFLALLDSPLLAPGCWMLLLSMRLLSYLLLLLFLVLLFLQSKIHRPRSSRQRCFQVFIFFLNATLVFVAVFFLFFPTKRILATVVVMFTSFFLMLLLSIAPCYSCSYFGAKYQCYCCFLCYCFVVVLLMCIYHMNYHHMTK